MSQKVAAAVIGLSVLASASVVGWAVPAGAIAPRPVVAVTVISPVWGPTSGGTVVTVSGHGFNGDTYVTFGLVAATLYTVVSTTQMTAVSPAQVSDVHNVYATTAGVTSGAVTGDRFTYGPPVEGLSRHWGTSRGGTPIVITGLGFTGDSDVDFGVLPASCYTIVSATEITAVSPPEAVFVHQVFVSGPAGVSPAVRADRFTYIGPLTG